MSTGSTSFADEFARLTGNRPMRWQQRLFDRFVIGEIPAALDLPTGLGKTSVIAIWLLARAFAESVALEAIPRRLVYVVDRRAVVDQATAEAEKLRHVLEHDASHLQERLRLEGALPISTLRGAHVDNREWLADPATPAIVVGTVDMIGSRLLFEGYGVSRKMRPYHAGLLGVDALIVLDEAHLVPPFASLLRAIESGTDLWPRDRDPLPRFMVLPLSATHRQNGNEQNGRESFGLQADDRRDEVASRRLDARKRLQIELLPDNEQDGALAAAALRLAVEGGPARVVVYCDRRDKRDEGKGPSAQGVAEAIEARAKRDKIDIEPPQLLVGGRRVRERELVARKLQDLGFAPSGKPGESREPPKCVKPTFLVATAAGEVGVDLDADHMVCDLVPWERMVQRLGRVNRRGGDDREAEVVVFDSSHIEDNDDRKQPLAATRELLEQLVGRGGSVSPAALLELREHIDPRDVEKACTPEPLRPALTRALVDAWSMTSLEHHTGRPEVAPWLRGWESEEPQTAVVWRTFLPLRIRDGGQAASASKKEIDAFFDAAPPHESEKLETETYRVVAWLRDRAEALLRSEQGNEKGEAANVDQSANDEASHAGIEETRPLRRDDVVVLVLTESAEFERALTLADLAEDRKGAATKELPDALGWRMVVVDARFGGLKDGMLDKTASDLVETADSSAVWSQEAQFRVRQATAGDYRSDDAAWRFEDDFVLATDGEGDPERWLVVEHFRSNPQSEEGRSISRLQELADHQKLAEEKAVRIAKEIGLAGHAAEMLALAASLHDEGKRAWRWQRAFNAPREKDENGQLKIFAKTRGPIDQQVLDGYRHEFGTLAVLEPGDALGRHLPDDVRRRIDELPGDWRDLVLHLIAAHHGRARPVITTSGCESAPPSALEARAREVALRFARLQKRWGPWGLAWWEGLLRAADQQASRDNDAPDAAAASRTERS